MSWERDNYVVGARYYVVGTRSIFFHMSPLCCRNCGTMAIDKDKYLTPSQRTRSTRSSTTHSIAGPDLPVIPCQQLLMTEFFRGLRLNLSI